MQQAARISDYTAFFLLGEVIEVNKTTSIFGNPQDKRTEDYITGGLDNGKHRNRTRNIKYATS